MRFQNILIVALAVALANANVIQDAVEGVADFISDVDDVSGALNIPSYLKIPTAIKKYSLYANQDEEDFDNIPAAERYNIVAGATDDDEVVGDDVDDVAYADEVDDDIVNDEVDDDIPESIKATFLKKYASKLDDEDLEEFDNIPAVESSNIILSAADENGDYEEGEYDEEDVIDDKEYAEIDNDNAPVAVPGAYLKKGQKYADADEDDVAYADADEDDVLADDEAIVYPDEEVDEVDDEFDNIPAVQSSNIILSAADENGDYEEGEYDEDDVIDDKGYAEIDNDNAPVAVPGAYLKKGQKYADADEDDVAAADEDIVYPDEEVDEVDDEFDNIPAAERYNIILSAADENGDYEEGEYDEEDVIDDKEYAEIDNDNAPVAVPGAYLKKGQKYADADEDDVAYADADEDDVAAADEDIVYPDEEVDEVDDEFDNIPAAERYNIILSAADENGDYEEGEYDEEDVIDDKEYAEIDNDNAPVALKVPAEYIQKYADKYEDVEEIDEDVANAEEVVYADADENNVAVDDDGIEKDLPASIKAAFLKQYNADREEELAEDDEEDMAGNEEVDEEDIDDMEIAEIDTDDAPVVLNVPANYIKKVNGNGDADATEEGSMSSPIKIATDIINENGIKVGEENDGEYVTIKVPKSYLKNLGLDSVDTKADANVDTDANVDIEADTDADADVDTDTNAAEAEIEDPVKYVKQFTSKEAEMEYSDKVKDIVDEVEKAPIAQKIAAALKAPSAFIKEKLEDEAKAEEVDDIVTDAPVKIAAALKAPSAFIAEAERIEDYDEIPEKSEGNGKMAAGAVGAVGIAAAAAGVFFWVKKSKKRDIKDIEEVVRMEQMNNIRDYEEALKMEQTNIKIEN